MSEPYHAQDPPRQLAPDRGAVILVLGILSWLVCPLCGIAAWVMGNNDLAEMAAGRMNPAGQGLTTAGRILGMISVILACVSIVLGLMLLALGVIGAAAANG